MIIIPVVPLVIASVPVVPVVLTIEMKQAIRGGLTGGGVAPIMLPFITWSAQGDKVMALLNLCIAFSCDFCSYVR